MQPSKQNERRTGARIETHGNGIGAPSEEAVEQRAQELALLQGRGPEAVTADDRKRAAQELHGEHVALSTDEVQSDRVASNNPTDIAVETGHKAPVSKPADEQQIMEQEIKEGMREAEHERLVEGQHKTEEI